MSSTLKKTACLSSNLDSAKIELYQTKNLTHSKGNTQESMGEWENIFANYISGKGDFIYIYMSSIQ